MPCIQILFCYCFYDDGFHVLVSRRYDTNLDFVLSSAAFALFDFVYIVLLWLGWDG
jgi:hypothetical protein